MVSTSGITVNGLWAGTKKAAHHYANFCLGVEQCDSFSTELQKLVRGVKDTETKKFVGGKGLKDIGGSIKQAWKESLKVVEGKSFTTVVKDSFKSMGSEFKELSKLPKFFGKSGKASGAFKVLGKRMPLIANLVAIGFAVPNIFNAFTDKKHGGGVVAGVAETGKEAIKLAGFTVGAAIGQAIIPVPVVGGLIGGLAAGWIMDKIVGKSFTDKRDEQKEKQLTAQENGKKPLNTGLEADTVAPQLNTQAETQQINSNPFNSQALAYSSNPFSGNYMDKDLMAMSAGLVS